VRERLTRQLWLAAVVIAFCVPLFVGLGRTDMENDEAIYSYAVDGILARGDWLNPPLSPDQGWTFLEKPPLKFWIVAAPIKLGLLPHNEVGMRVWDVTFATVAFLYVFAIGRRLRGPLCGFFAVMVLFVYEPLIFTHGLRNNNMEAPLFLCYCGGIYHYLSWASAGGNRAGRLHIWAVLAYFFLGFMTKFVAAFFLPIVLAVALILDRDARAALRADIGVWVAAVAATLVVAAPWFVYETMREGRGFWRVLVGEHVYQRFTTSLDRSHLQPWHYYFTTVFHTLDRAGAGWTVLGGFVLLAVHAVRERRREAILVVTWFAIPIVLISIGSSKIHHYVYPFLPPLALAAGYGVDWVLTFGRGYVIAAMAALQARAGRVGIVPSHRGVRYGLMTVAALAAVLAVATFVMGTVEWKVGDVRLFRNSHVGRPLAAAVLFALIAGRGALAARALWPAIIMVAVIPVNHYENMWKRTLVRDYRLRAARECLTRVQQAERAAGRAGRGVYSIGEHRWFTHSYYYYLRDLGWEAVPEVDPGAVDAAIATPGEQRPVLTDDQVFHRIRSRYTDVAVPRLPLPTALLLMPGPYGECDTSTRAETR
jgi:4-amino-4-deoxy-L-arabinose transferase-like glycosyltransferase